MYEAHNYDHLLGTQGFSDEMLKNHFTLYQGYVTNTNTLLSTMKEIIDAGKMASPEYSELNRRFGWEFNGMRLHELYFDAMNPNPEPLADDSGLKIKLVEQFGSIETWKEQFVRLGTMRGIGWVILTADPASGKLFNVWVNEHDVGHLATTTPILVMDVFEHAFMIDYGLKRPDYIESYFKSIQWTTAAERFVSLS